MFGCKFSILLIVLERSLYTMVWYFSFIHYFDRYTVCYILGSKLCGLYCLMLSNVVTWRHEVCLRHCFMVTLQWQLICIFNLVEDSPCTRMLGWRLILLERNMLDLSFCLCNCMNIAAYFELWSWSFCSAYTYITIHLCLF